MKDYILDLLCHTHTLGIDLAKIVGTDVETTVSAIADDRSVIVKGKFKNPNAEFVGISGYPNLGKLKTILNFEEYKKDAVITMTRQNKDGEDVPVAIHFSTANGDFVNDYRLMSKQVVEEKVKSVKFAGATWHVQFEPKVQNIDRLKKQSSANSEQTTFVMKTEGGNLKIYFGDHSSHSGNFVFEEGVSGNLTHGWAWPVKQFLSIMNLPGEKRVHVSDQGAMLITVDSGICDYDYLIPASVK
jgi:hypothetical protein